MTNPLAKYLGIKTGRIADDTAYEGNYVVCLGEVDVEDEPLLGLNNFIHIQQIIDLTDVDWVSLRIKGTIDNIEHWHIKVQIGTGIMDYKLIPDVQDSWVEFKINTHHMLGNNAVKIELRYVP